MDIEEHHNAFLDAVEAYLRPLQERVKMRELGKRIRKPPEIHRQYPSFTRALRADPEERFQFYGADNDLSVQLTPGRRLRQRSASPTVARTGVAIAIAQSPALSHKKDKHLLTLSSCSVVCTITQERMRDPVITADGFTYERSAIEKWFLTSTRSPSTNAELQSTNLTPNRILKQIIDDAMEFDLDAMSGPASAANVSTENCRRAKELPQSQFPCDGEKGLWVYEVMQDVVMAFTDAEAITHESSFANSEQGTGWVFVKGQLVSSSFRKANAARIDVVQIERDLGWLCASHLRPVEISHGLRVFQSLCNIGTRYVPDTRKAFFPQTDPTGRVDKGDVLSSSRWIESKDGTVFLRSTKGWVPDQKRSGGQWVRLMTELQLEHSLVVYRVMVPGGLHLRRWPSLTSDKVKQETKVEQNTLVGSRTWLRREEGAVYVMVEHEGVKGWVFTTKIGKEMERVSARPQVHWQSPGSCVQAQLGPREGSWMLLLDEPGGAAQAHHLENIGCGLGRQINNCEAKGRRVDGFAMCPDMQGWVCSGVRPDGTGGHRWTGGLQSGLAEVMLSDGTDAFALGTNDDGKPCGVAWNTRRGGWRAHGMAGRDVRDLTSRCAERISLLHDGQFWAACRDGSEFWRLGSKHLEKEVRNMRGVLAVTQCPETGAWLVIAEEHFRVSNGIPEEMEQVLARFYGRRKAQRSAQQKAAAEYDAILARHN